MLPVLGIAAGVDVCIAPKTFATGKIAGKVVDEKGESDLFGRAISHIKRNMVE
jgi:hypothetical protein